MGTMFRNLRVGWNENESIELNASVALEVTNWSGLDNRQGLLSRAAAKASAKQTGTAVSSTSSRSSSSTGTGETRLPADRGCAEATAQGKRWLGVRIRQAD